MPARLSEAFILGLSMGPACLGYCSPVFVPLIASEKPPNWRGTAGMVGLLVLGRLAGYSLVGLAIGILGNYFLTGITAPVWGFVRLLMGIMLIVFGMTVDGAGMKWCPERWRGRKSLLFSGTLGLLTGLNLCPPFGAAIAGAAATASVKNALYYFWAFFAGTAVYFAPFALIGPIANKDALRQIARICIFLAGAWLILEGAGIIMFRRY